MRAVYQSTQKYLSLSYYEVNSYAPAMSEESYDRQGRYMPPKVVGSCVEFSVDHNYKSYTFMEGEKHNQLTLTDPTEIRNMREYIKRRGTLNATICEIFFEGDEAELRESVVSIEQEKPVKRVSVVKGIEYEELSDRDKRIYSNLIRR